MEYRCFPPGSVLAYYELWLTMRDSQVNTLFELDRGPRAVASIDDLVDGITLAYVLHELDSEFDPSLLETSTGSSRYLNNKRNLQAVYKGLFRFIRRQVPELGCQAKKFDYHGVAENPEPQGLSQLMAVMVAAAAMGPDNSTYIPRVQNSLDRETQGEIMNIIRTVQEDYTKAKDEDDHDEAIDAVLQSRDIDLLVEEQNAALRQQLDANKKSLSDYITRLEHLQLSYDELQYAKEENDRELEVLRKATQDGANSAQAVKLLEARVHEQMDIIAKYEDVIQGHERAKSQLETDVSKLTQKCAQADELRDQATEWKHKAEEFEKKANTAERFKQKLESQQHLVKEVQNLQYERADLQEQLRTLMDDKERTGRMRKAEDELTMMITQSEQHLWDERNQKNQLIRDVAALEEEMIRMKAQRSHDENYITDLQEQLQQGGGASRDDFLTDSLTAGNLEDELRSAGDEPNFPLELSRLKAENGLLRRTVGSTGDAASLRRELEEEKRHRDRLQQNFNDIFEKHAVAQDQIESLINNMTSEGLVQATDEATCKGDLYILTSEYYRSQAFANLRTELAQTTADLEQLKKKERELQAQNSDKDRELLESKTQLSAVEKGSVDALDELKSTDKLISESLKSELDWLRDEHSFLLKERDAQKSQLIEALLAKDKLRKDAEDNKDLQEAATTASTDADAAEAAKKAADKIEKLRARLKERQQVSEEKSLFVLPEEPEVWPTLPKTRYPHVELELPFPTRPAPAKTILHFHDTARLHHLPTTLCSSKVVPVQGFRKQKIWELEFSVS